MSKNNFMNTDILLQRDPFLYSSDCEELFYNSLREELIFHYEHNKMYRAFCEKKDFSPYSNFRLEDIPPISASVFKNLGERLSSVPSDDIRLKIYSSATSGIPSTVTIDKITSRRQSKAMIKVVQHFLGKGLKPFLIMDIDPRSGYSSNLGARFAAVSGYLKFSNKSGFFLSKKTDGSFYFNIEYIVNFLKEVGDQPVVLFGFTYILYSYLLKDISKYQIKIPLPKGSKIIHIGGWKKLESEKISKLDFNKKIASIFEINSYDIIDIYGFTEQMGLNYPDFEDGWKYTPLYSRVIVRDPVTHEVLPPGNEGVLEFLTPIPHSYPGNAILTDDLGIVKDDSEILGTLSKFKVTGRLKKAEVRGCGDILSQKLTFQNDNKNKVDIKKEKNILSMIMVSESDIEGDDEHKLRSIISYLNKSKDWIIKQPVEALIGLVSMVASSWLNNEQLNHLRTKGLIFASSWLDNNNLTKILELSLRGNIHYLDRFELFPNSNRHMLKANPKGLVCHWLAGNVQILGIFALVQSILSKNVNLLRVSSNDEGVFNSLLSTFKGKKYTTPDGYTIKGDDLLKTIAVIYYPHDVLSLGKIMSEEADVRIAWGGNEAISTVADFPSKIGAESIFFGPKLSFAVISSEALDSVESAKKIAKRLSVDISVFDQTGCASPHNLYIENKGKVSVDEFINLLDDEMKKTEKRIPKSKMSVEQISQIHSIRGVYDFKGKVIGPNSMSYTLLKDDANSLEICSPVYSRVMFIHSVESIFDCLKNVNNGIQTIGLAASGKKAEIFAEKASLLGVERFPKIGRMLNFEMPWDGVFLLDRLVRWNTLGGPLV